MLNLGVESTDQCPDSSWFCGLGQGLLGLNLGVESVDECLDMCWFCDLGQGFLGKAQVAAKLAVEQSRSPKTLLAHAVVKQLLGELDNALVLYEEAFALAKDDGRRFVTASLAIWCEKLRAAILPDGTFFRFPESYVRYGKIPSSLWENRFQSLESSENVDEEAQFVVKYVQFLSNRSSSLSLAFGLRPKSGEPDLPETVLHCSAAGYVHSAFKSNELKILEIPYEVHRSEFLALAGNLDAAISRLRELPNQFDEQDPRFCSLVLAYAKLCEGRLRCAVANTGLPEHFGVVIRESSILASVNAGEHGVVSISDPERACECFQEALSIYKRLDFLRGAAAAERGLAWLHAMRGQNKQAFEHYQHSQELATKVYDPMQQYTAYVGRLVIGIFLGIPRFDIRSAGKVLGDFSRANGLFAWGLGFVFSVSSIVNQLISEQEFELALRFCIFLESVFERLDLQSLQLQLAIKRAQLLSIANIKEDAVVELKKSIQAMQDVDLSQTNDLSLTPELLLHKVKLLFIYVGFSLHIGNDDLLNEVQRLVQNIIQEVPEVPSETQEKFVESTIAAAEITRSIARGIIDLPISAEVSKKSEEYNNRAASTENSFKFFQIRNSLQWLERICAIMGPQLRGRLAWEQNIEEEACLDFEEALRFITKRKDVHLQKALIFEHWNRIEDARIEISRWIEQKFPKDEIIDPWLFKKAGLGTSNQDVHLMAAKILTRLQDWQRAREQYELAGLPSVGKWSNVDGYFSSFYQIIGCMVDHAKIAWGLNEKKLAFIYIDKAFQLVKQRLSKLTSEKMWQALTSHSEIHALFGFYCQMLFSVNDYKGAFQVTELARSGKLMAVVQAAWSARGNIAAQSFVQVNSRLNRITAELALIHNSKLDEDFYSRYQDAIKALDQAELDSLQSTNSEHSVRPWLLSVKEIQDTLPDNVLVIVCYIHSSNLYLWALAHSGFVATKSYDSLPKDLSKRLEQWLTLLEKGKSAEDETSFFTNLLISPVDLVLDQFSSIIFIPHGLFAKIPLHILPWQNEPLIYKRQVSYLPAASLIVPVKEYSCNETPVVIGEPANMSRISLETGQELKLSTLPGSLLEAYVVASMYHISPLVGEAVKEKDVYRALNNRPSFIHFATHGFFSNVSPLSSGLVLANGDLLTVDEVVGLDLEGTLVILSACETAISKPMGSDTIGLARAMIVAGAREVIASLWKVPDVSSLLLFQEFYRKLQNTSTKRAIAHAQKWLSQLSADKAIAELDKLELTVKSFDNKTFLIAALDACRAKVLDLSGQIYEAIELNKRAESLFLEVGRREDADQLSSERFWLESKATQAIVPLKSVAIFSHPRFWAPYILVGM